MASSSNANNSSDILSKVKKLALTKSIDVAYSCIHVNEIKSCIDTFIHNLEEKKRHIEATNLIHKDVVYKYLDDEIKVEKQEVKYLEVFLGIMLNTRCCSSLDDLPVEILSWITGRNIQKTSYLQEFAFLRMFEGIGPKDLNVDVFIHKYATHKNVEAMYRQVKITLFSTNILKIIFEL
uniref:Uncharacterized protein n=1 Tax=Lactuca sativa TaxID=4236 RepID=A0A9R1URQ8_LACSA|nr:hypothetical protein LSAT_V11C800439730 [Lactuca sativa]